MIPLRKLLGNCFQECPEGSFREVADGLTPDAVLAEMSHWSKWTTVFEAMIKTPPPWNQNQKLLGNCLQEGAEGSFLEVATYQNLHSRSVAKTQVRKLLGNYLQ